MLDLGTKTSTKNQTPSPQKSPQQKPAELSRESLAFMREYLPDEFVLTAKSQDTLSGFWEVTPDRAAEMESRKREAVKYVEVIRLRWPEQSLFDLNYALIPTSFSSRHECLRVPFPNLPYRAELGLLGNDGSFLSLLISNESSLSKSWGIFSPVKDSGNGSSDGSTLGVRTNRI